MVIIEQKMIIFIKRRTFKQTNKQRIVYIGLRPFHTIFYNFPTPCFINKY